MFSAATATWGIAGLATLGVVARPWNLPEFIWAAIGAVLLVAFDLLPWREALTAAGKGVDVYFFLIGMMLLAEVARKEGLFDWLAVQAVRQSRRSASRFVRDRICGRHGGYDLPVERRHCRGSDAGGLRGDPRGPRWNRCLTCSSALSIANAASFVLPISNPANLVVFGERMPTLLEWLRYFALPSVIAIVATFVLLRFSQRESLQGDVESEEKGIALTRGAAIVAFGIGATAVALLAASALGRDIGLPTFVCGADRHGDRSGARAEVSAAGPSGRRLVGAAAGRRPLHSRRRAETYRRASGSCRRL